MEKLIFRYRRVLRERFGVKQVTVFGAVAGDAPLHESSDLDLLVESLAADRFWEAWQVSEREVLEGKMRVDLVRLEEAPQWLIGRILGGRGVNRDPILSLYGMVERELNHLRRVVRGIKRSLLRLR